MPVGRFVALSATLWLDPLVVPVITVYVTEPPWFTVWVDGDIWIEKSFDTADPVVKLHIGDDQAPA
jgi:hypothetical protein